MVKRIINWIVRQLKTYEFCEGRGCYVMTLDRNKAGRPYCSCCEEEGADLRE